jgi:Sporulation and spore germination
MRPPIVWLALLGLCVGPVLAGCAIGADDAPRDIDRSLADADAPQAATAGAAAIGSGRIFLLAPEVPGLPTRLAAVARDVPDDATAVLSTLLAGPNRSERDNQFRTALPDGIKLSTVLQRAGGVLSIDVSSEILTLSGDGLIAALAQIVFTASAIDGVDSVQITVAGGAVQWPANNGELTERPLTVYDYPGWDPSSQPAYPGVPAIG